MPKGASLEQQQQVYRPMRYWRLMWQELARLYAIRQALALLMEKIAMPVEDSGIRQAQALLLEKIAMPVED